jgi:anhydro-N-acetylmuramic acid kinase
MQDSFFEKPVPKTTGPELFNLEYLDSALSRSGTTALSAPDILATLAAFSAETIAAAIRREAPEWAQSEIYLSGGGAHNPSLIGHLRTLLPGVQLLPFARLGMDGDAKEAVLFAALANETLAGGEVVFPNQPSVSMGKISFPG